MKGVDNEGILVVSLDEGFRSSLRGLLESEGYRVLTRESIERVIQLLELQEVTLLITDHYLADGSGFDLITDIRSAKSFYDQIPIYLVANDINPDNCVEAFDVGATEYTEKPLNKKVFLARVKKIVSEQIRLRETPITMAVKVDANEATGIFQLLETEGKTGELQATCHKSVAEFIFHNGRIVRGESARCAGEDALTEVLSWPFVQMRFTEKDISGEKRDCDIIVSTALMDCVLALDKYREVEKRLFDSEMSFSKTEKLLPRESNAIAKKAHRLAASGNTLDEIVDSLHISRRHALTLIDQLIRSKYITIASMPFENYRNQLKEFFLGNKLFFSKQVPPLIDELTKIEFPLLRDLDMFPLVHMDDISRPTMKILLAGDDNVTITDFFNLLHNLAANTTEIKNPVKVLRKDAHRTRLDFPGENSIELVSIPSKADDLFIKQTIETMDELVMVLFINSTHQIEAARNNRRRLKQLRRFFKGYYCVITPVNDEDDSEFKINCDYCGNSLTMDMDKAGAEGLCPICNTHVIIPDQLRNAHELLKLPEEVLCPIIPRDNPERLRDLLILLLTSLYEKVCGSPVSISD